MSTPHAASGGTEPDLGTPLAAALATTLGAGALVPVFTGPAWIPGALLAIGVVAVTGLLLRWLGPMLWSALHRGRAPSRPWVALGVPLVPILQLAAVGCLLTARFAPARAIGSWLPTPASIADLGNVLRLGSEQVRESFAPAEPLTGLCALTLLLMGLVAVIVDLVAVAGRQPALAALPLLVVLTVPISTLAGSIGLVGIIAPLAGLALLLRTDSVRRGGRRRPFRGAVRAGALAVTAVVAALVVTPALPTLAEGDLLESWGTGGDGGSTGTSLDPAAALHGELTRSEPIPLFRLTDVTPSDPGYLRAVALEDYDAERGWTLGALGDGRSLTDEGDVAPSSDTPRGRRVQADITVLEHDDRFLPVLASPVRVRVDDPDRWRFDPDSSTVFAADGSSAGETYLSEAVEPQPTTAQLAGAERPGPDAPEAELTALPSLAPAVGELVQRLTGQTETPLEAVQAIYGYLTDPANGWTYSLRTPRGSSGDDLADFLANRAGFCEQYAGAMAVLVRAAGVPARVVLGYTPGAVQADGSRLVTSDDAHAWVEVWFGGVGWVPYDPTPLDSARAVTHPYVSPAPDLENRPQQQVPAPAPAPVPTEQPVPAAPSAVPATADGGSSDADPGVRRLLAPVAVVLAGGLLLGAPAALRIRQRRRRLAAGNPAAAWDEIAATARDLGIAWDPARTPRQAAQVLGGQLRPTAGAALAELARAEESASYARPGAGGPVSTALVRREVLVTRAGLAASVPALTRLRATLAPASLLRR